MARGKRGQAGATQERLVKDGRARGIGGGRAAGCAGVGSGPGERDVGMVRAALRLESAGGDGGADLLLQAAELRGEFDAGNQDSGAGEDRERQQADGERRGVELAEAGDEGLVLRGSGGAEEGEGDMPGFRSGPAEPIVLAAEARGGRGEFRKGRGGQGDAKEETHGGSLSPNLMVTPRPVGIG